MQLQYSSTEATAGTDLSFRISGLIPAFHVRVRSGQIAKDLDTKPSRVALAWVQGQEGVTSTIIGARTMAQLDDNLAALDLELEPEHLADLDAVSMPQLNFPAAFLKRVPAFAYGGTTINGQDSPILPIIPADEGKRY